MSRGAELRMMKMAPLVRGAMNMVPTEALRHSLT
ncbi:hypothetical protein BHAP_1876 [Bifidobacterium hapali]|uniref:Uncharacterized protein n=1 Tax=Bifidobacterium hapali TaxID=1630172 RepID=A0A261FVY9_9BIFI|nr:hypothetical protein BHAP_1876 [Bifidobacterium hapali]